MLKTGLGKIGIRLGHVYSIHRELILRLLCFRFCNLASTGRGRFRFYFCTFNR
jgi:hypothetical protein